MAAMLVELTIEANKESFVIVLQHGGNDVTCKWSIRKPNGIIILQSIEVIVI